jgi:cbb3-type cytochrome c oxidase subunit III
MRLLTPYAFAVATLVGALVCGCQKGSNEGGGAKTASGDSKHGEQIFMTTCATCHGADGKGIKGLGKSLVDSEFVHKASEEQLVQMIAKGRDAKDPLNSTGVAMPPNGGNAALTENDLRDVVAYVRALTKG